MISQILATFKKPKSMHYTAYPMIAQIPAALKKLKKFSLNQCIILRVSRFPKFVAAFKKS